MKRITLFCVFLIAYAWQGHAQVLTESFDGTTLPVGWTQEHVSGTEDWEPVTTNGDDSVSPRTGSHMVEFRTTTSGDVTKLITPSMDITGLISPQLTFYFANVNWVGDIDELRIYYRTSATGTWTQIGTDYIAEHTTWEKVSLSLPNPSVDYYIAFEATSNWARGLDLDDVTVGEAPTCLAPSALTATNIKTTNADLGWAGATATTWDVEVVAAGTAPTGTPTDIGVTTNPYNKTGLTAQTAYEFYVRADCGSGDLSTWAGPYAFTTLCAAYTAPYVENFSGNSTPTCWTESGTTAWSYSTAADYAATEAGDNTYGGGTNYAWMDGSDNVDGDVSTLTSPLIDVSSLANPALEFNIFSFNTIDPAANMTKVEFYDGANWIMILNVGWLGPQWQYFLYDLSTFSITGPVQLRITVTGTANGGDTYNHDVLLDDVAFIEYPTCQKPSNLQVNNITATTADLNWTDNNNPTATLWDIELVTAGTTPTGTPTASGVSNPYNATGLTQLTDYEYYVRTDCGGGDLSAWEGPFSFSTPCGIYSLPFVETFDDSDTPDCWVESGDNSWDFSQSAGYAATSITDHTPGGGTDYAWMDGSDNSDGEISTLTSPLVDVSSLTTPAVKFYLFSDNTNSTAINIIDVEFYDGAAWNNILNVNTLLGPDWVKFLIDVSGYTITGDVQVRFTITGNDNGGDAFHNDILLDDVEFLEYPTCLSPTNLAAANVTANTADLSWTDSNSPSATLWDVEVVPAGILPTGTPTHTGVTNPFTATGLIPGVDYKFYVRTDCGGGDLSAWEGSNIFTTSCGTFPIPFLETFDDSDTPTCWTESGVNSWDFSQSAGFAASAITDHTPGGGTDYAWMDGSDNVDGEISTLTSPLVDISSLATPALKFFLFSNNTDGSAINIIDVEFYDGVAWNNVLNVNTLLGADWVRYIIDLSGYTITGDVQVRFTVTGNALGGDTFHNDILLDDVEFLELPTCLSPSNLAAANITANTADLSWVDTNSPIATLWDIEVLPAGTPPTGTPTDAGVTTNPFTKTGLIPQTDYEFYVRANCGGTDVSIWEGPYLFTTPCVAATIPYLEEFTTFVPDCWREANDGSPSAGPTNFDTSSWTQDDFANTGTNQAANISLSAASAQDWLISPIFDLSAGGYELAFIAAMTDSGNSNPPIAPGMGSDDEVQILISTDNGMTWTNLLTYNQANYPSETGDLEIIDLTSYTSTTTKFAIWGSEGTVNDPESYEFFIDNFEVRLKPSCSQPTNLTVTNITATSADLGWTENNVPPASLWDVELGSVGFTPTGTPTATGVSNPYNATLTPDTDYEFYIRADCGGGASAWTGPFAFSTPCVAATIPYTQSFSSGSFPTCWTRTDATNVTVEATCDSRSNVLNISDTNDVITVPIDGTTASTGLKISYYVGDDLCGGATEDPLTVSYWDGTQWVLVKTYLGNGTQPYENAYFHDSFIVPMSAVTAAFKVRFSSAETQALDNWYIDDLIVEEAPTCLVPTTLTAGNITTATADLGWTDVNTPPATTWDVHVVTAGDPAPTDASTPTDPGVTTNPYTKTTLTANTVYEFYVRADCGGGTTSAWAGPFTFTTLCNSTTVPYTLDFESVTPSALPNCTSLENLSGNDWETDNVNGSGFNSNVLRYSYNSNENADTWFYTQGLDLIGGTTYELSFGYGNNATSFTESLKVSYGTLPSSMAMTTQLADYPSINSDNRTDVTISFTPATTGTYYIGFNCYSLADQWELYVDDISVIVVPPCLAPSTLAASNITDITADISWSPGGSETEWEIEYGATGFAQGSGTTVTDNDGTLGMTLTGLSCGTSYDVYVRSVCGTSTSGWVGPFTFNTVTADPSSVTVGNITDSTADISWVAGGSETEWEIEYGATGFAQGSGTTVTDNDGTLGMTLTGLSCDTSYDVYVRSVCGTSTSGWVGPFTFNTVTADPSSVTVGNITDSTADISWVAGGSETEWEVEYGPTGFVQGAGTTVSDNDGTLGVTLTGLSCGTYDVYVRGICGTSTSAWIGPSTFSTIVSDPSNIAIDNITSNSADISWTVGGSETAWEIELGSTGFTQGSGTIISTTTLGMTLTGLSCGAYDVYVRAVCGTNTSAWIGPVTFSIIVPDPSNIIISNIANNAADVSWTPGGNETEWEIEYGPSPLTQGTGTIVLDDDGIAGETISGLNSNGTYDVYVRGICGGATSNWVGPSTFTTLSVTDVVFENFSYYPNPVKGRLSLKATREIQEVIIYNLLGQEVLKSRPDSLSPTLDLHNLQAGTYLMKVAIDGSMGIYRIIKE